MCLSSWPFAEEIGVYRSLRGPKRQSPALCCQDQRSLLVLPIPAFWFSLSIRAYLGFQSLSSLHRPWLPEPAQVQSIPGLWSAPQSWWTGSLSAMPSQSFTKRSSLKTSWGRWNVSTVSKRRKKLRYPTREAITGTNHHQGETIQNAAQEVGTQQQAHQVAEVPRHVAQEARAGAGGSTQEDAFPSTRQSGQS